MHNNYPQSPEAQTDRALTLVHYLCNCIRSQIRIHPGVVSTLGRHGLCKFIYFQSAFSCICINMNKPGSLHFMLNGARGLEPIVKPEALMKWVWIMKLAAAWLRHVIYCIYINGWDLLKQLTSRGYGWHTNGLEKASGRIMTPYIRVPPPEVFISLVCYL